jgi:hypothetical protein
MPFALRAFLRIDDVHALLQADRGVGALELTSATNGALRSYDLVGHEALSPIQKVPVDSSSFSSRVPEANI